MNFSKTFIQRPVLAVLLNLAIFVFGLLALRSIPQAALPSYDTAVINVSASMAGASPDTMASTVARVLEKQFQTVPAIKTISSTSTLGNVNLTLEFEDDRNIDTAAVDVQAALLRAQRGLPSEMTELPSYRKVNPADAPVLLLALTAPNLKPTELQKHAEYLLVPSLSNLPGVAQIGINGAKRYAVRIEVDAQRLAAHDIALTELATVLKNSNATTPLGTLEGQKQTLVVQTNGQLALNNAADFAQLVIANKGGNAVYLGDVANVKDSVETLKTWATFNGDNAITLSIQRQPGANTVALVDAVLRKLPELQKQLPASVKMTPINDRSISVRESLHDVGWTLLGTVALVMLVVFVFLRHATLTLLPALSLPISLLGAVGLLWALGYSLDNISLLGLTLAVGLVVDDSIVVVENIVRHIENGLSPMQAALQGSQEVGFTIVSISTSLVAVFIPIFFMPGALGLLFHEFAVVVGLSVFVSAFVSLTLVPMMAGRLLKPIPKKQQPQRSNWMLKVYTHGLDWVLRHTTTTLWLALAIFGLTAFLFYNIPKGFFPEEDIGQIQASTEAASDVSFPEMVRLQEKIVAIAKADPAVLAVNAFNGGSGAQNTGRLFITLKPLGQRPPIKVAIDDLRKKMRRVAGITVSMRAVQNLQLGGRASKAQYQYILQSLQPEELSNWAEKIQEQLRTNPAIKDHFKDVNSDAQANGLQASIHIDTQQAGQLGVSNAAARAAIASAFGENKVTAINTNQDSYSVILQLQPQDTQDESALHAVNVRSQNGALVPLHAFATVERTNAATAINHVGQLQAVTITFNLAANTPLGTAIADIDGLRQTLNMPESILTKYGGEAAAFQAAQGNQTVLLVLAMVVIYMLLGILYESYIHPITILAGLPSAAVGALGTLALFGQELTLIATIGLILLMGIVKKNAIMVIDFALDARRNNPVLSATEAVRLACILRFRPINMTTLAALMGALPLAMGWGAGAQLRQPLGLAVVGGLVFSQCITLLITPVLYVVFERWFGVPLSTNANANTDADADADADADECK